MSLWKALLCSLAFVVIGIWLTLTGDGMADRVAGIAAIAFFGLGAVLVGRQILEQRPKSTVAPDPLPAEERNDLWFMDEEPDENQFTQAEQEFLDALRVCARSLPAGGTSSFAFRNDQDGALVAVVSLRDRTGLLEFGLHLEDGRLRGDALDSHLYVPPDDPTTLAMAPAGADERTGRATAWLEQMLRRPIERLEWWHRGRPYATRYQFADTTEGLVEAFEPQWAPPGLPERLIHAGRARRGGWLQTAALGKPDAVVAVRSDGRHFETPRLPSFLWYQCPLEQRQPI